MKSSLENQILWRCPLIFRGRHKGPKQNQMCFGFACGDGWFLILFHLSVSIEALARKLKDDGIPEEQLPCVSQVKEKFGGLRFYVDNLYGDMGKFIDTAELLSVKTCHVCGGTGKRQNVNGWVQTICNPCLHKTKRGF